METPFVQISKIPSVGLGRLEGSLLLLVLTATSVWVSASWPVTASAYPLRGRGHGVGQSFIQQALTEPPPHVKTGFRVLRKAVKM